METKRVAVELWCEIGPRILLGKWLAAGMPVTVNADNLMELSCRSCRYRQERNGVKPRMVLHRFNIAGELVESHTIW